jgi:integration host factor subunit beta
MKRSTGAVSGASHQLRFRFNWLHLFRLSRKCRILRAATFSLQALAGQQVFAADFDGREIHFRRFCQYIQEVKGTSFREAWGMTKADLVEEVAQLGDLTRRDGEVIVDTIFDSVIGALKSGDKIEIRGFGSFRIRQRKPRIGRNPKTGSRVDVPAKRVPYFKPSKELRDLVNPSSKSTPAGS